MIAPDSMRVECFRHPTNYKDNEAHPSRTSISNNRLTFYSVESELKANIEWLDNYIKQANECYRKKLSEVTVLRNKASGEKRKQQEEIDRSIKTLETFKMVWLIVST